MIDSISSSISSYSSSTSSSSNRSNSNVLSFDQQQTLQDVLSNYDSDNLTTSDAQEIVSAFQDAGITPSKSLADAMESLGFDAHEVGTLAGVVGPQGAGGMPPPPPPPKEDENTISEILSELLDSDDEDDNSSSYTNAYSSNNSSVSSFESVLDYTSRILSLNDEAKEQVMDLFESYKPGSTELSSKDVSNIIKSSLQDILGDSNNYNSTSFYA